MLGDLTWAQLGIVAGIATAVATTVSVCLLVFWRLVDRERVEWIEYDVSASWRANDAHGNGNPPKAELELANVGRGIALALQVVGVGCVVLMQGELSPGSTVSGLGPSRRTRSLVPALRTGETVHLLVMCEPEDWDKAQIVITWTPSARLIPHRRVRRQRLRTVASRPRYERHGYDAKTFETAIEPMPEPPGPHLPGARADIPLPPPRWRILARAAHRRELRRPRS